MVKRAADCTQSNAAVCDDATTREESKNEGERARRVSTSKKRVRVTEPPDGGESALTQRETSAQGQTGQRTWVDSSR
jgi:hypothetical protein